MPLEPHQETDATPLLVAIVIACLGSTAYLEDKSEDSIHGTLKIMQTDLREVRNDVKNLLKKGG